MKTRAEHYREAERLMQVAEETAHKLEARIPRPSPEILTIEQRVLTHTLALAQIHATLATVSYNTEQEVADIEREPAVTEEVLQKLGVQTPQPAPSVLDPKPYVSEKGVRYAVNSPVFGPAPAFLPREEYEQDIKQYPGAHLSLDPKPWAYALTAKPGDDPEKAPREATQVTGGFVFYPRKGYAQNREDYA